MHELIYNILSKSIGTEYANDIASEIAGEVADELVDVAGINGEYNEDDYRIAIGRVLCKHLNCEVELLCPF